MNDPVKFDIVQRRNEDIRIINESPESVYIDGFQGASLSNQVMRINFFEDKVDPVSGELTRDIVLKLLMPLHTFNAIADKFKEMKEIQADDLLQKAMQDQSNAGE